MRPIRQDMQALFNIHKISAISPYKKERQVWRKKAPVWVRARDRSGNPAGPTPPTAGRDEELERIARPRQRRGCAQSKFDIQPQAELWFLIGRPFILILSKAHSGPRRVSGSRRHACACRIGRPFILILNGAVFGATPGCRILETRLRVLPRAAPSS
jgi:hypothetical protein